MDFLIAVMDRDLAAFNSISRLYAALLSDKALKWLTDNAVIITEQRSNAVESFRCISDWLEGARTA